MNDAMADNTPSPLLSIRGVTLKRGTNTILREASLEVFPGELVYLIGRVGAGKSTLIKSVYADIPVSEGELTFMDYDVRRIKRRDIPFLRRKIGIIFQDFQLLTDRSVEDNLEFVLHATGWKDKREIAARIDEVLRQVGLETKSYKMPHELSGGEQQRTVIARALLNKPNLILADEPTGNLDPETGDQILSLLLDITKHGTAVLMSTHNYTLVRKYPARIAKVEEDGRIYEVQVRPSARPEPRPEPETKPATEPATEPEA